MKIATAASFLWLMKVVYCQVVINTTCPKLDVVHNFQLKRVIIAGCIDIRVFDSFLLLLRPFLLTK